MKTAAEISQEIGKEMRSEFSAQVTYHELRTQIIQKHLDERMAMFERTRRTLDASWFNAGLEMAAAMVEESAADLLVKGDWADVANMIRSKKVKEPTLEESSTGSQEPASPSTN